MADSQHQDNVVRLVDFGQNAKVTDPVTPDSGAIAGQSMARASRVFRTGNAVLQKPNDPPPD